MLEQGEVLADDLLPKLADELHNRFGKAAEDASDNAQAAFNRFSNAWLKLKEDLAKSGILDGLVDNADELSDIMTDPNFQAGMVAIGNAIGDILTATAEGIGALGSFVDKFAELNEEVRDFYQAQAGQPFLGRDTGYGQGNPNADPQNLTTNAWDDWQRDQGPTDDMIMASERARRNALKMPSHTMPEMTVTGSTPQGSQDQPDPNWLTQQELLQRNYKGYEDFKDRLAKRGSGMSDTSVFDEHRKAVQKYEDQIKQLQMTETEYLDYTRQKALDAAKDKYSGDQLEQLQAKINKYYDLQKQQAGETFDYLDAMSRRAAERMQDNFSNFFYDAFTGELDSVGDYFNSFARSMLRTWTDMQAKMLAKNMFGKSMNFSGGWVGSTFDWISTNIFHDGGTVGRDIVPQQPMPASMFDNAPRLHNGLAADEYPAILQRGETVVPKGESKSDAPDVHVNVINHTGQQAEAEQQQPKWDGEKWVLNIVLDAANRNKNGFGRGLRGALNKA
jgi:hypothetical protein